MVFRISSSKRTSTPHMLGRVRQQQSCCTFTFKGPQETSNNNWSISTLLHPSSLELGGDNPCFKYISLRKPLGHRLAGSSPAAPTPRSSRCALPPPSTSSSDFLCLVPRRREGETSTALSATASPMQVDIAAELGRGQEPPCSAGRASPSSPTALSATASPMQVDIAAELGRGQEPPCSAGRASPSSPSSSLVALPAPGTGST